MTGPRKLGLPKLVASTFFMVSGGAYGLEELVSCGYTTAILALLVTPLVWSLPTALMVGELASAVPEEGGYYAWVRRALGPFWGFQEAWLSVVASVFDMAIYPTIVSLYLGYFFPAASSAAGSLVVGAAVIGACTLWNLRGASPVGSGSVALGVAVQAPFVLFAAYCFLHAPDPASAPPVQAAPPSAITAGLLVAMWNFMGWDNVSTIAEEVHDPERNYPRAVLFTLALVALTYVIAVGGAAVAGLDPAGWTTGAWVSAARHVGGRPLALLVIAGGMVCGVGMFNALLLSYSRLPAVLAEDGYLPAWLGRRNEKTAAPSAAILLCAVAYTACLGLGFNRLVALDVMFYGASLVLEFVALVVLRVRAPKLARPFRVPGGTAVAASLGVAPLALLGVALWHCKGERFGPMSALAFGGILALAGPVVYRLRRRPAASSARSA